MTTETPNVPDTEPVKVRLYTKASLMRELGRHRQHMFKHMPKPMAELRYRDRLVPVWTQEQVDELKDLYGDKPSEYDYAPGNPPGRRSQKKGQ